jgi:hypothetical protein
MIINPKSENKCIPVAGINNPKIYKFARKYQVKNVCLGCMDYTDMGIPTKKKILTWHLNRIN